MIHVFLNNGREFQEIAVENAVQARVVTDTSPEFNGAPVLVCFDHQQREIARFKWSDVSGYVFRFVA